MAKQTLPPRGAPLAQSGAQNHRWPTSGQSGYISPTASERGAKSEAAHLWQDGYITPAAPGIPTASKRGAKSEVAHKWSEWLHNPCRLGVPHRLRAGGKIRSGPQVGKMATQPLPPRGSPPPQSGGQNQKWPTSGQGGYITNPCRIRDPHRLKAGGKIKSGPQVRKMATQPTPAALGIPTASERGAKSEVAH